MSSDYSAPSWVERNDLSHELPKTIVSLARLDTPLHEWTLPGLPQDVKLLIKRDDTTGDALLCGNKVRKLEFLLADALRQNCDCCVTVGGTQSNHARATVAACRRLNLEPHLVLRDDSANHSEPASGNLFLDKLLGANLNVFPKTGFVGGERVNEVCEALRHQGRRPYAIPSGGSCALGCWGYLRCFDELTQQLSHQRDVSVVAAVGSGATALGLAIGNYLWSTKRVSPAWSVIGYTVCDSPDYFHNVYDTTLPGFLKAPPKSETIVNLRDAAGLGYGRATQEELQFLSRVGRETGVLLDPSYTNKAARGLVMDAVNGQFSNKTVVFVHTGGAPGAFAYASQILGNPA